jgi:hypothetical protein
MFKHCQEKYIYYKINNQYFRIPTHGKIMKIIDWGRCTFDFNGFKVENNVFSTDGMAFEHYIYPRINCLGKKIKNRFNESTDLVIFGMNVLTESGFPKSGKLHKFIKSWLTDQFGQELIMDPSSFDFYQSLDQFQNANPFKQIKHKIWNLFKINKSKIPTDKTCYQLMF